MTVFIDILCRKTCLERSAVLFTPVVPMGIFFAAAQIPPFSYGLYTFCMNSGMLVWFGYLLAVNSKEWIKNINSPQEPRFMWCKRADISNVRRMHSDIGTIFFCDEL